MRIALCQITSDPEPDANLDLITEYTARAAEEGAQVVVFPEATMARFGVPLASVAQPVDGRWGRAVDEIAARHGVLVVAGMFTPAPDGRVFNTLLITGRGQRHWYHKIHLYDAFGFTESRTVAPGDTPLVIRVNGMNLGLATCYDVRFPALFQELADAGAAAILLPASWGVGEGKREQWEMLVRARALDCTSWVLACDQADPHASGIKVDGKAPTGIGWSTVADPFGRIHAQLGASPGVLVVDVEQQMADEARETIAVLANRRR